MTTTEKANRRKLTNMLIDPRLQLLLFLPYLVTLIGFVITNLLLVRYVIASFGKLNLDAAGTSALELSAFYHHIMVLSSIGLVAVSVIGFLLVIVISHRLLGPLYNIQRHVRRLKSGEYHHQITLRRGDRLSELADDLNVVTTQLSALAGTSAPRP